MAKSRTITLLNNWLRKKNLAVPGETLQELEVSTREAVHYYFRRPKRLRRSAINRQLRVMANGLRRASDAANRLGEEGMLHLFAASNANREPDNLDLSFHIDYLRRMARWAGRATEAAVAEVKSARDDKGGRTPDKNLRSLMVILLDSFQRLLAIRPTHTVDPETGLGESLFDQFAKSALSEFAPDDAEIPESRRIDGAIIWALESRDFEAFEPPRM